MVVNYLLKLLAFGFLMVAIFYAIWVVTFPKSEVFKVVETYLCSSPANADVGKVESISPQFVGFSISEDTESGNATVPLSIRGARSTRRAVASAVKRAGVWTVSGLRYR
jgi:hypothetical protein